jgi:hypothetical protein
MDIRLTRGRNARVWLWTGLIVAVSAVILVAAAIFGDPTEKGQVGGVGAAAKFGADRAPVLPVVIEPFESLGNLSDRELGRIVHVSGTAESAVRRAAVYVRTRDGRRILLRFEPTPDPALLRGIANGGAVNVNGYLMKISRAEFDVWIDTLGVSLPRPAPGVKFGDLPDSNFIRIDSLFVKDYYISVRPEGIGKPGTTPAAPAPQERAAAAPPPAAPAAAPVTPPVSPAEAPAAQAPAPAGLDTVRP